MQSYTKSLRHQLRGTSVEVLEIVPPAVHTGLLGSDQPAPHEMPLDTFIEQLMALFDQQPTPQELCVENALFFRRAEADGKYDETFAQINEGIAL